jgi:hypothetical protein
LSAEVERDYYKSMFDSLNDTCDMHTEYIEELKKEIINLKGNPPKIEPPPKYKEDLQGEIYQKIFTHGYASLIFDMKGNLEGIEELEAAFLVLKNIKPFKAKHHNSILSQQMAAAQAQGLGSLGGYGLQGIGGLSGSAFGGW